MSLIALAAVAVASSEGMSPNPDPEGFDCGQCHTQTGNFLDLAPPEARAGIRADVVGGTTRGNPASPLALGEPVVVRVTVESQLTGADRALGVGMALVASDSPEGFERAGVITPLDDQLRTLPGTGDLTHVAPIPWEDGRVVLEIELVPEVAGELALYVVVNDVDGSMTPGLGDFVWPQWLCVQVGEGAVGGAEVCDGAIGWVAEDVLQEPPQHPVPLDVDPTRSAESERGCATAPGWGVALWWVPFLIMARRGTQRQPGGPFPSPTSAASIRARSIRSVSSSQPSSPS